MFVPVAKSVRGTQRAQRAWLQAPVKNITSRGSGTRCCPPSTTTVVPVTPLASARYSAAATTSSGRDARPNGVTRVSRRKAFRRLIGGLHREARREPDHPHLRRQRLRKRDRGGLQRRLRQRIGQVVRVHVVQLLVQHVDDHAALRFVRQRGLRRRVVQYAREHERRAEVHRGQLQQQFVADVERGVFLEARGVVHDARRPAERRDAGRQQAHDLGLIAAVRRARPPPAAHADDFRDHLFGFVPRGAVVDRHVPAARSKAERERASDAARGAGNRARRAAFQARGRRQCPWKRSFTMRG